MNFLKSLIQNFFVIFVFSFAFFLIMFSSIGRAGVARGIILCGRVIIPSLFPFTMCVIYITKSGILDNLSIISPLTNKLLGLSSHEFSIFLLSLVGGYPIGAKLLNESVITGKLHPQKASDMIYYCINAGPAFIVSAVGSAIFASEKVGIILFISHITASFVLCLITKRKTYPNPTINTKSISPVDNFVVSAAEASNTLLSICGFVILFSAVNEFLINFGEKLKFLKTISLFLEITNALDNCRNIFLLSFILGFGGICIWCQVIAAGKKLKINYLKFALFRVLHGILSSGFTYCIIKFFKISLSTGNTLHFEPIYSTPAVTLSLTVMGIIFVIAISQKKYNCKLLDDIV